MAGLVTIDEQMADAFPGMIWTAGPDRLCRWLSRRWLECTGRSLADELNDGWVRDIHPDDVSAWMEGYRAAFAEGRGFTLSYRLRCRDGRYRMVLEQAGPLQNGRMPAAEYIGFCADLTDFAGAADACPSLLEREQKALAEAQAAHRMKDDFISILSHGLRSPLNTIMMAAQLLGISSKDNPDVAEAVETILDSVRVQSRLIEELLDTSRVISGRISLTCQAVDLAETAETALAEMAAAAQEKGVTPEPAALVRPATVQADPGRVRQILKNLLTNAVKFTPAGGKVELSITRSDAGSDAGAEAGFEIRVSDTGEGIAADVLPVVFDPSRRPCDPARPRPRRSLGVGLAVVRKLAEMHGGTVRASSEGPGKGSTFIVTLPIAGPG
jgi:signal transduction histidine kinase